MKIKNVLLSTFLAATMCSPAYAVTEAQQQQLNELRHGAMVTKGLQLIKRNTQHQRMTWHQ